MEIGVAHIDAQHRALINRLKYEWHKDQHQLFVHKYQKLKEEFANNGFSAEFSKKLSHSIVNWIVKHIKSVDVEFGKYYQVRMPSRNAPRYTPDEASSL